MCNKNLRQKSAQGQETIRVYGSTVILPLPFFEREGDTYLKSNFQDCRATKIPNFTLKIRGW